MPIKSLYVKSLGKSTYISRKIMKKLNQRRLSALLGGTAAVLLTAAVCLSLLPDRTASTQFSGAAPVRSAEHFRLDLNDATAEELESLPGIGPALAEHILERRAELGGFRTREDVLSVSGIGEATYTAIEPYITY